MAEERRLTAIMFTDVCGFSGVMGENEGRAMAILEMANSCVDSGTRIYSGRIIKKLGDGLLVEFSSAVNAVRCAIEVQRAVAAHNSSAHPSQRFQMRIGIHVGDVVVAGDDAWNGLRFVATILKLAGVTSASFKVDETLLADDGLSAVATMMILKRDPKTGAETWDKLQPTKWRKVKGEWLIALDAPAGTAGQSTQQRPRLMPGRRADRRDTR